jgi:hypothetical protein
MANLCRVEVAIGRPFRAWLTMAGLTLAIRARSETRKPRRAISMCRRCGASGSPLIELRFPRLWKPEIIRHKFWGVWNTDDAGTARLQHVWMTVEGA